MFESYQGRSDNIFWAALFLSALIHLAALIYLKLPEMVDPIQGKRTLSVILAKPQEVGQPIPEIIPPPALEPIKKSPLKALPLPVPEPITQDKVEIEPPIEELQALPEAAADPYPGETLQAVPADPVMLSTQILEAGKVSALLQIDKGGAVKQIIWNRLPAVTDEILQRMEKQLRARTYLATGSSYTVSEIVEVPRE